jgi:hypothetical protein
MYVMDVRFSFRQELNFPTLLEELSASWRLIFLYRISILIERSTFIMLACVKLSGPMFQNMGAGITELTSNYSTMIRWRP